MNNTNCLMCKSPFLKEEINSSSDYKGSCMYSLNDCGLSPEQFEGQDGFLCQSCRSKQIQDKRLAKMRPACSHLEHPVCLKCKSRFKKQKKGYKRRSLKCLKISPEQFGGQDGYLCFTCVQVNKMMPPRITGPPKEHVHVHVNKMRPPRTTGLPKEHVHVPVQWSSKRSLSQVKERPAKKKKREQTTDLKRLKIVVLRSIRKSHYDPIFRALLKIKSAKKACHRVLNTEVRKEIKAYPRTHLAQTVTAKHVADFSWDEVVDEASSHMPILVNVLKAALPDPSNHTTTGTFCGHLCRSMQQAYCFRNQRLGFILSLILYSLKPRAYSFIQGCVSLQLWKLGCSQKLNECLHVLGVCKGLHGTATAANHIQKDPTETQKQWQRALSKQLESSAAADEHSEIRELSLCSQVQTGVLKSPVVDDMDADVFSDMTVSVDSISDSDAGSSSEGQEIPVAVDDRKTHKPAPCNEVQAGVLNSPETDDVADDAASEMSVSADDNSDNDAVSSPVAESASIVANVADLTSSSGRKHDSSIEATSHHRKDQASKVKHMPQLQLPHRPDPGYTIVCDNVLMQSAKRRTSKEFTLQASIFALRNRVAFDQEMDYTVKCAEDIPLSDFLPTSTDWYFLKHRMCLILERILNDHFPFLETVECSAPEQHQHSHAMSKKSEIVSLGVIDQNPFSTAGSISILESLHQFVPSYGDENLYPIVCFGDGLSVEKMVDAKRSKAGGASAADRLEGLVQCPQDFHRRGLLLQDTMNRFFKEKSATDRGTLFQLKQDYGHQSVKRNVMENFNHVEDLIVFCTRAFSIILALKLAHLEGVSERPGDFPYAGPAVEKKWLAHFTRKMINFIWPGVPSIETDKACRLKKAYASTLGFADLYSEMASAANDDCCKCGESTTEAMIRCSNIECGWFHYSCQNVDGPVEGDWWCSRTCAKKNQASKSYRYCKCHKRTGKEDDMIQCELQSHCTFYEWYHPECINVENADDLPEEWYCSPECEQKGLHKLASDGVQEYSRALLYEVLCHLAFRDAVREGDGPAILSHWKINTLQFWNSKHLEYFVLAHNMLAGVNGFYPARVAHDMTWNRVANLTGQADGNIGLDLVKELPTEDYHEMLSQVQGVNPKHQGEHSSKLSDTLCRDLDNIFLKLRGVPTTPSEQERQKFDQDIQCFAASYIDDGLFDFVPGRHHKGFPFFKHSFDVESPETMGAKLLELSKSMDMSRGSVQS